jgi:hypothetical protein
LKYGGGPSVLSVQLWLLYHKRRNQIRESKPKETNIRTYPKQTGYQCALVPLSSVQDPVACSSEDINKHPDWIKARDHVHQISDSYLLEKKKMFRVIGLLKKKVAAI